MDPIAPEDTRRTRLNLSPVMREETLTGPNGGADTYGTVGHYAISSPHVTTNPRTFTGSDTGISSYATGVGQDYDGSFLLFAKPFDDHLQQQEERHVAESIEDHDISSLDNTTSYSFVNNYCSSANSLKYNPTAHHNPSFPAKRYHTSNPLVQYVPVKQNNSTPRPEALQAIESYTHCHSIPADGSPKPPQVPYEALSRWAHQSVVDEPFPLAAAAMSKCTLTTPKQEENKAKIRHD